MAVPLGCVLGVLKRSLCFWVKMQHLTYAESKHLRNDICSDENFGSRFRMQVNARFGNGTQTNTINKGKTRKRQTFGCLPAKNEEHKRHAYR
jgi:hypothetical protein